MISNNGLVIFNSNDHDDLFQSFSIPKSSHDSCRGGQSNFWSFEAKIAHNPHDVYHTVRDCPPVKYSFIGHL